MKKLTILSLVAASVMFTACGEETKTVMESEEKSEVSQTVNGNTDNGNTETSSKEEQSSASGTTDTVNATVEQITDEVKTGAQEVVDETVEAATKMTDPFGNPIPSKK